MSKTRLFKLNTGCSEEYLGLKPTDTFIIRPINGDGNE